MKTELLTKTTLYDRLSKPLNLIIYFVAHGKEQYEKI